MSRLKRRAEPTNIDKLVGRVRIYSTRLGAYRYVIEFRHPVYQNGRRICLVYTGATVNNRMYGVFTGLALDEISGHHVPLKEAPEQLIEDAIKWLP